MIALTKILLAALISFFCAVTGFNLDLNQNIVKNEQVSNSSESHQKQIASGQSSMHMFNIKS